jgi:hypothetical protein
VPPPAGDKTNAPEPKKKPRAASTPAKKKRPTTAGKTSAKPPALSDAKPAVAPAPQPTDDQIRIRAYFIAERRHRLSLPGDSNHDWIEARRQLIEEAGR